MGMPRHDRYTSLQTATTITAAETAIGTIDTTNFSTICFYVDLVIGDSTSYDLIPYAKNTPSGDEHQICSWSSSGGTKTVTQDKFRFTATGKYYFVLDVRGINRIVLKGDATGGTPIGTAEISYIRCSE